MQLICAHPADYANPIEPSARGGERIAGAIAALVTTYDFSTPTHGPTAMVYASSLAAQ